MVSWHLNIRWDASADFEMIHPPDVIEKYAPDAVIGTLGTGAGSAPASNVSAVAQVAASGVAGGRSKDYDNANKNRTNRMDGYGRVSIPVIGPFMYMVLTFMKEFIFTFFGPKNIVLINDRVGLSTQSATCTSSWDPEMLMGTGISTPVCTGQGLVCRQTSIVEEHVLLSAGRQQSSTK